MATTAPQAGTSTPVWQLPRDPQNTNLSEVTMCGIVNLWWQNCYLNRCAWYSLRNFHHGVQAAFAKIWPKIDRADITIILHSVKDTELRQLRCLSEMLCPDKEQPKLVEEQRNVPTLDNILGNLVNKFQNKNFWIKRHAHIFSDVFSNLVEAHRYYAAAAKGLADVKNLVSPEQLTGSSGCCCTTNPTTCPTTCQVSPLLAPPPVPKTSTTPSDRKELIQFCKNNILPDPSHSAFNSCDARTPTRVLAAAVYCILENTCSTKQPHVPKWRPNFVLLQPSCTKL